MDGTRRWDTHNGEYHRSPTRLTSERNQQDWTTPINTSFGQPFLQPSEPYALTGRSYTQQLNSIDISPENENSSLQAWPSAVQAFTSQPGSYSGNLNSTAFPKNTAWSVSTPNHALHSNSNADTFIFPKFDPIGLPGQKSLEDTLDLNGFDAEFNNFESNGAVSEEHNTIINLNRFPASLEEPIGLQATCFPRRQSGSSFVSSAGPMNDPPDVTYPETLSYSSDYTPQSSALNVASTPLSPVPSPRCTPQDMVRTSSNTRASASPRPTMRPNPYSLEAVRNQGPSAGSFTSSPIRRPSPYPYTAAEGYFPQISVQPQINSQPRINSAMPSSNLNAAMQYNAFSSSVPRFQPPSMPPSTFDPTSRIETMPYMLANGTFRTLQSNVGAGGHVHDHFCDHADPPDLFGPLSQEQLVPPLDDMKPEEAELTPHEQELRFEGDLYTPKYVRGHGNKREGWCGICKPGRWLVLKNSAYWYDKSFTHGISAASGQAFEGPRETRRMDGNADVWEGLCGSCGEWIALVSSKKKGTTWFRHAYKCHTHSKVKDAPKRRRESNNQRPATTIPASMHRTNTGTIVSAAPLTTMPSMSGRIETVAPTRPLSSMV